MKTAAEYYRALLECSDQFAARDIDWRQYSEQCDALWQEIEGQPRAVQSAVRKLYNSTRTDAELRLAIMALQDEVKALRELVHELRGDMVQERTR